MLPCKLYVLAWLFLILFSLCCVVSCVTTLGCVDVITLCLCWVNLMLCFFVPYVVNIFLCYVLACFVMHNRLTYSTRINGGGSAAQKIDGKL